MKIDSTITLQRNFNRFGTLLAIKTITGNIIERTLLTGKFNGEMVLLPFDSVGIYDSVQKATAPHCSMRKLLNLN